MLCDALLILLKPRGAAMNTRRKHATTSDGQRLRGRIEHIHEVAHFGDVGRILAKCRIALLADGIK
jgi:hypothetical protein